MVLKELAVYTPNVALIVTLLRFHTTRKCHLSSIFVIYLILKGFILFILFYKFYYFDRQFCESLWYTLGACNDYVSQSTRTLMSLLKENLHLITFIMCILVFFMFIF